MRVHITADLEQDCPPYLDSWRGMEQGVWALLEVLRAAHVPATFFVTGDTALRYPDAVRALIGAGHELACHGMTHRRFTALSRAEAAREISESSAVLRAYAPVHSFRAPYLAFPEEYLDLLETHDYLIDASRSRYKPAHIRPRKATSLLRVPASIPPSVLRLPRAFREPWVAALREPIVLFVHPWEFVDLRNATIPLDCRFNTGAVAMDRLAATLSWLRERGAKFNRLDTQLGVAA